MKTPKKAIIIGAAMTGLLTGAGNLQATENTPQDNCTISSNANRGTASRTMSDDDKHSCKGQNSCKGKGGCKGSDNGCKGKNSCKGKGGCKGKGDNSQTES